MLLVRDGRGDGAGCVGAGMSFVLAIADQPPFGHSASGDY